MDQHITPAIRCNGNAEEAARFYADVFREGSVVEQVPGYAATVSAHGFRLSLISGGDQDTPNPSISCILNFDPLLFGGEDQARAYLDELYEHLSTGGVLMELGEYPFSPRYAWVRDRFGMTWQLMLTDPAGHDTMPGAASSQTTHKAHRLERKNNGICADPWHSYAHQWHGLGQAIRNGTYQTHGMRGYRRSGRCQPG